MVFQAGFQGEIIANAVKSRESVPEVQMDFLIRWKSDLNHTADFGQFEIKSSAKGPSRGIQGDRWLYDNHVIPMLVLPLLKSANPSTPDVLTCVWKWPQVLTHFGGSSSTGSSGAAGWICRFFRHFGDFESCLGWRGTATIHRVIVIKATIWKKTNAAAA